MQVGNAVPPLLSESIAKNISKLLTKRVIAARQADQFADAETLLLEQAGPAYAEWLNRINQFIDLQQYGIIYFIQL